MKSKVSIPVSYGELIDRITILELKSSKIRDRGKNRFVRSELKVLSRELKKFTGKNCAFVEELGRLKAKLFRINLSLWNIENRLRGKEARKKFDRSFITLARSVYLKNDLRSEVKEQINILLGQGPYEVKQYTGYKA